MLIRQYQSFSESYPARIELQMAIDDLEPPPIDSQLVALSRLLSKVLRHEPELVGVRLDANGWVRIDELIEGIQKAAREPNAAKRVRSLPPLTRAILLAVVVGNDKRRFSLSADGERIRAVQGHSVPVELGHSIAEPPSILFHGTAAANWPNIAVEGLKRLARHAVHLSADAITARRVGARHGRPIVLEVAAAHMYEAGFQFSQADNGVWLVMEVPPKYLRLRV